MIIIEGPDHTGKTTLARELESEYNIPYFHFTKDSGYMDYLSPLCRLDMFRAVLDRHAISEYAYADVMDRPFKFTMKQWHNILLLTLVQMPLIVLCMNKPAPAVYREDQYLPYDRWDRCLDLYKRFLTSHNIAYLPYDYKAPCKTSTIFELAEAMSAKMDWWRPLWDRGYGCIGSTHPKLLLVAERLGPDNIHNIPFETGPTGHMLTDLLTQTGTPLGKFAVTNLVKSFRMDTREVNQDDLDYFDLELSMLKPDRIAFMGTPARAGIPIANSHNIPYYEFVHFGYYSHRGDHSITRYIPAWQKALGMVVTESNF